ncbi:helix-turn-helix transcriptional regulator [Providencia sp.]|uniref:helix-turn-helix transcriptional regulator n=1 Tax=Providencia sp. TaxID=589 RepID=UPI0035B07D13
MSIGNTIKKLRVDILKINQEQFGKLVGISRKTISEIENDRGNLSADSLSAIMKPFNLRLTLLPTSNDLLEQFKKRINQ